MKKLVIDLGHGGKDPGAVGKGGTKEADVVLSIGKYLNDRLKGVDLEVRFTRLSDKYLSLSERVKVANEFNADYFLSIHINSANDSSVRGIEVWQYSDSDKKVNDFSNGLCKDISSIFGIRNRGIKISKSLYVLKHTSMKAMLVEVDFISNNLCELDLKKDENLKKVAIVIKDNLLKLCEVKAKSGDLYKVCIGSYKEKSNAAVAVNLAKEKGFKDAYIISQGEIDM